jgi:F-type H+-transporting ATPase subunit h
VDELYLKELKNYKAPPVKASDSEGQVQKWAPPAPPKAPEDGDIAQDLKAYEESTVEVEGQASTEEGAPAVVEDWLDLHLDEEPSAGGH